MRDATASATSCRSRLKATRPKRVREVKSALIDPVTTARRLCPYGQAAWRKVGAASDLAASELALAARPITQE
jgi:hypothetical protein